MTPRWSGRTPIAWTVLPLLVIALMFAAFSLGKRSTAGISDNATGRSSVVSTRPTSQATTAKVTTVKTATQPRVKSVLPAQQTTVKITRWGHPTTQPKETVYPSDPGCTQSNVLARQDANRCYTTPGRDGGNIADPCFPLDNDTGLMCPSAPWSTEWILVSAVGNAGLADPPTSTGLPWGIEIAGGVRCSQMGGGTAVIGDQRMNYACPNGNYLWGDPSTSIHRLVCPGSGS
jgi:hypothetical protein